MKSLQLNRVEARYDWEVAFYISHGYRIKYDYRGNRIFMVRAVEDSNDESVCN